MPIESENFSHKIAHRNTNKHALHEYYEKSNSYNLIICEFNFKFSSFFYFFIQNIEHLVKGYFYSKILKSEDKPSKALIVSHYCSFLIRLWPRIARALQNALKATLRIYVYSVFSYVFSVLLLCNLHSNFDVNF